MKSLMLSMSVLASATLATPVVAAEHNRAAAAPSAMSVQAVTAFVGTYAGRSNAGSAEQLVLYPTANGEVVFVTFRTTGESRHVDHIGMVSTRSGRVTRYTDLTGPQPRRVPVVAAVGRDDAQSQARALLVAAEPLSGSSMPLSAIASRGVPLSAQSQAADLLRSASSVGPTHEPRRVVALEAPAVHGDSQALARAVLTMSMGE